jgi:hypothetical protein
LRLVVSLLLAGLLCGCGTSGAPGGTLDAVKATARRPAVAATPTATPAPTEDVGPDIPEPVVRQVGLDDEQDTLEPWEPYALGAIEETGDSLTIGWRTEQDSRAIVYIGKASTFATEGYTQVLPQNTKARSHQVKISGLERFTKYKVKVLGLAPLGLRCPSQPIEVRTGML